ALALFEDHRVHGPAAHHLEEVALEELRADQALRRRDLEVLAVDRHLAAFAVTDEVAVGAADAQVDLGFSLLIAQAEPAREMLRLRPGIEDKVSGRIELTDHDDFDISAGFYRESMPVGLSHRFPPWCLLGSVRYGAGPRQSGPLMRAGLHRTE